MKRYILMVLMPMVFAAMSPGKELSSPLPTSNTAASVMVSGQSEETDVEIAPLRVEQQAARARGDETAVRRIEHEIQLILVRRQPQPECRIPPPTIMSATQMGTPSDGPDVLIELGSMLATATDYEEDGTMWTVFSRPDSNTFLYRSTDHGEIWQYAWSFNWNFVIGRLGLIVGQGDSNFIHVFVIRPDGDGDLYDLRFNHDGTGMQTLPVRVGPDTIGDFAVGREYNSGQYFLYALVNNELRTATPGRNAFFLRSGDFGQHWTVCDSFTNISQPHLSVGSDAYVYFTCRLTPSLYPGELARGVNANYGSHGSWSLTEVRPDLFRVADPVIGAAFTQPESLATIWCLYSHDYNNSGDWDILYSYSTDGGTSWQENNVLAFSTDDEEWPDLKHFVSPDNPWVNASYLSTNGANYRTVYRCYANAATPMSWSDTLRINSRSAATGREVRPLLVYSPGSTGTGAGCVFAGEGLQNLYWNSPWNVSSIAEKPAEPIPASGFTVLPSPGRDHVRISYTLPEAVPVRLDVLDQTGRSIATLVNATQIAGRHSLALSADHPVLADGVYFLTLAAGAVRTTRKLILR